MQNQLFTGPNNNRHCNYYKRVHHTIQYKHQGLLESVFLSVMKLLLFLGQVLYSERELSLLLLILREQTPFPYKSFQGFEAFLIVFDEASLILFGLCQASTAKCAQARIIC